jgi:hypothetical protein
MGNPGTDELRKAVKLFNRWQFQEAQDAFQQLADASDGTSRQFLAAIGDIAAGFHRIWHKNGEAHAMVEYLQRGIDAMKPFPRGLLGLQADPFLVELEECLAEAKRWRRGDSEIFNRDFIPRLVLQVRSDD